MRVMPSLSHVGSAKITNASSFCMTYPLGLGEQGHDFTSWWPFQTGHSLGSNSPFPLHSHVAKGTPNSV